MMNAQDFPSTRPYLIRALYEWCTDNGFTPYLVVRVDESVQVPRDYVNNGEIVLNVSYEATSGLQLGNDFIEFKARFGGKPCDLLVPMHRVIAIYARENGQGMAFPLEDEGGAAKAGATLPRAAVAEGPERAPVQLQSVDRPAAEGADKDKPHPPQPSGGGRRPALKRIK